MTTLIVLKLEESPGELPEDLKRWVDGILFEHQEVEAKVVGLFKSPTKFCDPSDGHRGKKTDAGWTRGLKYGWWVCGVCKKPSSAWSQNLNAVLGAAKNLLTQ